MFVELERRSLALRSFLGWWCLVLPFGLFCPEMRKSGTETVQRVSSCLASLILVSFWTVVFSYFFFKQLGVAAQCLVQKNLALSLL